MRSAERGEGMIAPIKAVNISVTTLDGEMLDSFVVTHWKADVPDTPQFEDAEAVGSNASESLLVARLRDRVMNLRRTI